MKHLKLATTVVVVLAAGIWLMQPEDPERKNPFGGEVQALSTGILSPREGLMRVGRKKANQVVLQ